MVFYAMLCDHIDVLIVCDFDVNMLRRSEL